MMSDQRSDELNEAIAQSRGAIATVWEYAASLSQLSVRITWPGSSDNLHLVCNACRRIEMYSTWEDVNFSVQKAANDFIELKDENAKFFVQCGLIRVLRDVEPIFLIPN